MVDIRGPRWGVVVAMTTATLAFSAACGAAGDRAPSVSEQSGSDVAHEVTDAFENYWSVYVQIANSGDVNVRAFDGIADGPFLETVFKALSMQADSEVVRVGEPVFCEFTTTVEGDTASSVVCRDDSQWGAERQGELIEGSVSDTPEPRPYVGTLELRDGHWVVTNVEMAEDRVCP